jgi:membrane protease YdiL (CAAX protease family)
MKPCGYCGRENDDRASRCMECGTEFEPSEAEVERAAPARIEYQLNARFATLILFAYLGVQIGVGFVVGAAAVSIAGARGWNIQNSNERNQLTRVITGPTAVLATIAGGVAMVLISFSRIRQPLKDTSPTGAAWVIGSRRSIIQGLVTGAIAGCCYCAFAIIFRHAKSDASIGPIAMMAVTPGLPQLLWFVLVLITAPVVEELLFRGVLYGGYRSSFGPVWATVLTTAIFWVMHLTEMIHFWPSMVGVAGLALVALWWRLRSAAIGPAVAVHFGYNAILAVAVLYATFR